jgi:hypothetical protein
LKIALEVKIFDFKKLFKKITGYPLLTHLAPNLISNIQIPVRKVARGFEIDYSIRDE